MAAKTVAELVDEKRKNLLGYLTDVVGVPASLLSAMERAPPFAFLVATHKLIGPFSEHLNELTPQAIEAIKALLPPGFEMPTHEEILDKLRRYAKFFWELSNQVHEEEVAKANGSSPSPQ